MTPLISGLLFSVLIAVAIVWMIAIVAMMDRAFDRSNKRWAAAAILTFAAPFSVIPFVVSGSDHPGLCVRGHQEYQRSTTLMPVGKVLVPTASTRKVWVCEVWEQ